MQLSYVPFLFLCVLSISTSVVAEKIYKEVDAAGNVTFSTTPPHPGAKPAKLPDITRGEMELVGDPLATCVNHGGVNCEAGPSSTGTVICFDGFEGAAARYLFSCSSAKLEIAQISDPKDEAPFSVMIRNSKSVTAEAPELYLKLESADEITLIGPNEIEPFGVGEFVLDMKDADRVTSKPETQDFRLLCKNCS